MNMQYQTFLLMWKNRGCKYINSTHTHCDLEKQTNCGLVLSLFSQFERKVLIGRALSTDGCCYCLADCETAVRHQSDSKSLLVSSLRRGFLFYVILCNQQPSLVLFADVSIRLFKNYSLHFLLNSLFLSLTECAFTSSTNTSTSMILKWILCSQSLCSTY